MPDGIRSRASPTTLLGRPCRRVHGGTRRRGGSATTRSAGSSRNIQGDATLAHEVDALGRRTSTRLPDGQTLRFAWNERGRLDEITLDHRPLSRHEEGNQDFAQEAQRRRATLTAHYDYDPAGRLKTQAASVDGSDRVLIGRVVDRDAAGRIKAIHDLREGDTRYVYDPAGQLLDVQGLTPERFVHDPAGNLLIDAGGKARRRRPAADAGRPPLPLRRGRQSHRGTARHRWRVGHPLRIRRVQPPPPLPTRPEGHEPLPLRRARPPHRQEHAAGRDAVRVGRRADDRRGDEPCCEDGRRNDGRYDDVGPCRCERLADLDAVRWYVYEPGTFRPLARIEPVPQGAAPRLSLVPPSGQAAAAPGEAEVFYYHLDHLGTPREMTDARGRIVWSARYRAWGALAVADVHDIDNPLRFQGQYLDVETGLHYNLNRYYDPGGRAVHQPGSDRGWRVGWANPIVRR